MVTVDGMHVQVKVSPILQKISPGCTSGVSAGSTAAGETF